MFERLFSPLQLRRITLENRVCFLAHRTNFGLRGRLTDRLIAYYRRRAEGGCGLIIVGELSIHPNDQPWETLIKAYEPQAVKDYRLLTDSLHAHGAPVFAHLRHHGFQSSGAISRQAVWGPSAVADIAFGETAKPMEIEDIEEACRAFAQAAVFARDGGFDGLEIDMGPESLLRQFLSPISNAREDGYGGSMENRMRFPLEALAAVRKAVGNDFTVGVRLCVDEKFWGGISVEDSLQFAASFEKTGHCDFINTAVGTYYNLHLIPASMHTPIGFTVEPAEQIKRAVGIPVLASHQVGFPGMAEEVLQNNQADAVGFVRVLICDPDAPKKAREGNPESIRFCVKDNMGCNGRVSQAKKLGCTLNAEVGYEYEHAAKEISPITGFNENTISQKSPRPSALPPLPQGEGRGEGGSKRGFPLTLTLSLRERGQRNASFGESEKGESEKAASALLHKKIVVVGAGPAGMEAARVAKERGHEVVLYEKDESPGGQVRLISLRPGRQSMGGIINHLSRSLEKAGVRVIAGVEATPELILELAPDAVIIATGSKPVVRPVPGEYGPPRVLSVPEALSGLYPLGQKILFIDENGGHHATATVELFAEQGKSVTMTTSDLFIGMELAPLGDLYLTRQRLLQKGVTFLPDVRIDRISGDVVEGRDIYTNEILRFEGYDNIILDMGNVPEDDLYFKLKGKVKEIHRIGDCVAPRGIHMAIFEGNRVGSRL